MLFQLYIINVTLHNLSLFFVFWFFNPDVLPAYGLHLIHADSVICVAFLINHVQI